MTIPVLHDETDTAARSAAAILRRWRDPALTLAAFALVLTAVFGFGPFREPGSPMAHIAVVQGAEGALPQGPHLAGLLP